MAKPQLRTKKAPKRQGRAHLGKRNGHVSIQTTERYLRCKQKLRIAVNDRLGIEPDAA